MNNTLTTEHALVHFSVALGLGLLIGAERERRKSGRPEHSATGIRTFAMGSLLGAVSMNLGGEILMGVAILTVAAMLVVSYHTTHGTDPGLTTELSLIVTVLLGGLAMSEPSLAAGVAVVVTILLSSRAPLHDFVSRVLSKSELDNGLVLAAAALVIMPLAPDEYIGPFDAWNPRTTWRIVLLIMSISAVGYILLRLLGPRFGLPLAGLASGFVSSAATIGAMGARVIQKPELLAAAVAGATLSSVATIAQMFAVLRATSPLLLSGVAVPLFAAGIVALSYGAIFTLKCLQQAIPDTIDIGQPFSIKTTLAFAATVSTVMAMTAGLQQWQGSNGVIISAAIGGFVDAHSAAVAVASLVASGKLTVDQAVVPILTGLTTNTLTKMVIAFMVGGRLFSLRIIPGLILMIIAAWGALIGRFW